MAIFSLENPLLRWATKPKSLLTSTTHKRTHKSLESVVMLECNNDIRKNKSNNYVTFKEKTINPKKYYVKPNTRIFMPQSSNDVIITMSFNEQQDNSLETKALISKLTDEKIFVMQQNEKLQQELELLRWEHNNSRGDTPSIYFGGEPRQTQVVVIMIS
ncbi:hypothetical protein H5410_019936 [Solanum commersonii]|uniref:MSP domain-containing protein n=1 Tax=Solanum commersonii TaxID=4109 RepID=A0A9J5Z9R8_SOLCO|nr:hypothetical protein H5410_019936 [Solanum commersonii]